MKYLLPKYIEKFIYTPVNIPRELSIHKKITIVEGVFDSIGAVLLGFDYPVCIFGLHLSELQINLIKSYNPSSISIFLDDYDKSISLRKTIKDSFPTIGSISIEKSYNFLDPEEILKRKLSLGDIDLNMVLKQSEKLRSLKQ